MKFDIDELRATATTAKMRQDAEAAAQRAFEENAKELKAQDDADRIVDNALKNIQSYIQKAAADGQFSVVVLQIDEGKRRWDKATRIAWDRLYKKIAEMGLRASEKGHKVEYPDGDPDYYEQLLARWD